ncbi:MAG: tetratricopeptide repeat protein [Tannerella sp.]|jgi:LuxR family glucitol operon transcriptional activator|nr:tetratricopeptide repeat protein [Tannerella sp.]
MEWFNSIIQSLSEHWQFVVAFGVLLGIFVGFITIKEWLSKPKNLKPKPQEKVKEQSHKQSHKSLILNNLPPIDSIGELLGKDRKRKAKEILKLVKKSRIVLIEDSGGIGKSTIARDIAEKFKQKPKRFDAIIWINAKTAETGMNSIDLNNILDTTAQVLEHLHILSNDVNSKRSAIIKILQEKNVFFVFDNFETIIDNQIYNFMKSIPENNRVLVTARHLNGEIAQNPKEVKIGKLSKADGSKIILNELKEKGLQHLVNKNAIEVIYDFSNGLPLAIKFAIGQIKNGRTIESMRTDIDSGRLALLNEMFTTSWNMIDNPHKEIFKAMLFFVTPTISSKVLLAATNLTPSEFSDALTKLVDLSLINTNQGLSDDKTFFSMHPWTIRFSKNALSYSDHDETVTALNLGKYYVEFCQERYKKKKVEDYDELEHELPNMIKTIGLIDKNGGDKEVVINFAKFINVFLWSRGFWQHRIDVCEMAFNAAKELANQQPLFNAEAGKQAYYIGIVSFWQGKSNETEKWATESTNYMQRAGGELDIILAERLSALIKMGKKHRNAPEKFKKVSRILEKYRETHKEDVAIFADWVALGDKKHMVGEVSLLQETGICYNKLGDFNNAKISLSASKNMAEEIQDTEGLSVSLSHLGHSHYHLGEYDEAKRCYLKGLDLAERVQRKSTKARCCEGLAKIYDKKKTNFITKYRIDKQIIKYGHIALDLFEKLGMTAEYNEIVNIFKNRNMNFNLKERSSQ